MKKRTCVVFAILLLINTVVIYADSWPHCEPFYIISEDGMRVFHFTPEDDTWREWGEDRETFPTGVYYNTTPPELIYGASFPNTPIGAVRFVFSSDMQYFAWFPEANAVGHEDATRATAILFYANGIMQRQYMVSNLVRDLSMVIWTASTAGWQGRGTDFDSVANVLTITTRDSVTYQFDITTGGIINVAYEPPNISEDLSSTCNSSVIDEVNDVTNELHIYSEEMSNDDNLLEDDATNPIVELFQNIWSLLTRFFIPILIGITAAIIYATIQKRLKKNKDANIPK